MSNTRKTAQVCIRLTPEQRKTIAAVTEHLGLGLSSWVLMVALKAAREATPGADAIEVPRKTLLEDVEDVASTPRPRPSKKSKKFVKKRSRQ